MAASRIVNLALKLMSACRKLRVLHVEDIVVVQVSSVSHLLLCLVVGAINGDWYPVSTPLHFGGWRVRRAANDTDDAVRIWVFVDLKTTGIYPWWPCRVGIMPLHSSRYDSGNFRNSRAYYKQI